MTYIFINDDGDSYIAQDCVNFLDAICKYKQYIDGNITELFGKAIQNLTNKEVITLYNALAYNEDAIRQVYVIKECIYDDQRT